MDGLIYLLDITGRSLQAMTSERDILVRQVEELTDAIKELNRQLAERA